MTKGGDWPIIYSFYLQTLLFAYTIGWVNQVSIIAL